MSKYSYLIKGISALVAPIAGYYAIRSQYASTCIDMLDMELQQSMCTAQTFAGAERLLIIYVLVTGTYVSVRLFCEIALSRGSKASHNTGASAVFLLVVVAFVSLLIFREPAVTVLFPEEEFFGKWLFDVN
jgi:hypothetical protein